MSQRKKYLKIENFNGAKQLKMEIINFNVKQNTTGSSGSASGNEKINSFYVTRFSDNDSVPLMSAFHHSMKFPKAILIEESVNGKSSFTRVLVSFSDLIIANFKATGIVENKPTETIEFDFREIKKN